MNKTESAMVIACMAVIGSLSLVSAGMIRSGGNGSVASQDADKLRNLHRSMVLFACDDVTGALPTPGRINVWTRPYADRMTENQGKNTSGHLYSALIAQQYISTADVISPAEAATNVIEYNGTSGGTGYEYEAYDPANDSYWAGDVPDPYSYGSGPVYEKNELFRTAINRPFQPDAGNACYASYAHLQLCGKRKWLDWRVDAGANKPLLSNRGPKNGTSTGEDYTMSPTLLFYEPHDAWQGNVLFGDGHVLFAETFQPEGVEYGCGDIKPMPDNIFNCEFDGSGCSLDGPKFEGDTWLCLNEVIVKNGASGKWTTIGLFDVKLD